MALGIGSLPNTPPIALGCTFTPPIHPPQVPRTNSPLSAPPFIFRLRSRPCSRCSENNWRCNAAPTTAPGTPPPHPTAREISGGGAARAIPEGEPARAAGRRGGRRSCRTWAAGPRPRPVSPAEQRPPPVSEAIPAGRGVWVRPRGPGRGGKRGRDGLLRPTCRRPTPLPPQPWRSTLATAHENRFLFSTSWLYMRTRKPGTGWT